MSAGVPARHRAPRHGAHPPDQSPRYGPPPGGEPGPPPDGPPRRPGRRALVLLCCLLVLPLLAGAGFYLTRGSAPAPASATGKVTAAPRAPAACDPAASGSDGSCAGQP